MAKLNLAVYWSATCGGCDVALLDLNEKILDVANLADIIFWPIALDFKRHHVEALADQFIDVCLINGAVRNSEQEEMVRLLRKKSKTVVAFGSCACFGGIPGLANTTDRNGVFTYAYKDSPSTENPEGVLPQPSYVAPEGQLTLPLFYDTVRTLDQTIPVDYYQPGCPPVTKQIWASIEAIATNTLPAPGSTIGASDKTLCDECTRIKEEKKVKSFVRPHLVMADPERCFLEQGVICCGPATRGGCGTQCINARMPCRGCYGPAPGVTDQGAKFLSAIGSMIDSEDPEEIAEIVSQIADPLGTFYRFSLASSMLRRAMTQ